MVIGAIGHRVLAEIDRLESAVDLVLGRIESAFPGETWVLLSSLAEGADRLVAVRTLRRPRTSLIAVLPMECAIYEEDFLTADSRQQFAKLMARATKTVVMPPEVSRERAYAAAGAFIVQHCELLIALWDGQPSRGPGGTSGVIDGARARRLPLAWIRAGNRRPGTTEPTTLGDRQGSVAFESFPDAHAPERGGSG